MDDKVFISYRREDSAASAGRLYDALVTHLPAEAVFKDVDSIPLGADFKKVIASSISESSIVLAIIGRQFATVCDDDGNRRIFKNDDFVRLELSVALELGKVVVPVMVDGARMPESGDLPEDLRPLVFHNGIRLHHDNWARDIRKLLSEMAEIIEPLSQNKENQFENQEDLVQRKSRPEPDRKPTSPARFSLRQRIKERKVPLLVLSAVTVFMLTIIITAAITEQIYTPEKLEPEGGPLVIARHEDGDMFDPTEGRGYKTVEIGDQTWMAENLAVIQFNDGTDIPNITDEDDWFDREAPAYCWYNNDVRPLSISYGALYNGYTVASGALCPAGWHVPETGEWQELFDFLGGREQAARKLKEAGEDRWLYTNVDTKNETGFTATPGGGRVDFDGFSERGRYGAWWTSTPVAADRMNVVFMSDDSDEVKIEESSKDTGYSVRCIKDSAF